MATRRFELVEGTSSKFWEVSVEAASHTVRFGRIGTNGQSKTKPFTSADDARIDADRLVKEKLGKGYREVGNAATEPTDLPKPPKKNEPGVRTTLKAPRGKTPIVLVLSGARLTIDGAAEEHASAPEAKKRLDAFIRERTKEGFALGAIDVIDDEPPPASEEHVHVPDGDDPADPPTIEVVEGRWRLTFLGEEIVSEKTCHEVVSRLARETPSVVHVICDFASPGASWPKALAKTPLPSVRDFIFDTYFQTQTRQEANSLGDLRATLEACPNLERLFATGNLALTKGTHPKLRELYALGNTLTPSFLRAVGTWKLPALELLVLSLGSDAAPGDDDAAIDAVTKIDAPRVGTVHIDGLADVPRALDLLSTLGRWRELRLEGGLDEDALIEVVERRAEALRSLEVLGLQLGDDLSSGGEGKLRELCPSIRDLSELPSLTLPATYDAWRMA